MDVDSYSSSDYDEDGSGGEEGQDTTGNEGSGGAPEYANLFASEGLGHLRKFQDLLGVIAGIALDYDPTQDQEILDETCHKPLHDFLLSSLRTDKSIWDATCFDMYQRSMPDAMKALTAEIEQAFQESSATEAEQSLYVTELCTEAFHVGDGGTSTTKSKTRSGSWRNPKQQLAIKDKCDGNIHIKNFLTDPNQSSLGWRVVKSKKNIGSSKGLVRPINGRLLRETNALDTFPLMHSYKKLNWMVICDLAEWTRVFVDGFRPCDEVSEMAFNAQAHALSWLNSFHGSTLSRGWYREDFGRLASDANMPFLFDIVVAGMIGSDGSVGSKKERVFKIYQSNSFYCEELASAARTRYGVDPRVETRASHTLRWKPQTRIHFNVKDTEKLMLRLGSFDLNRPDQHIVLMLKILLINGNRNSPIQNMGRMTVLLDNLTSYIKRTRPS